jgi:hypothetical protein
MEKVKIDKMDCRFPTLFMVMWIATVLWMLISIANLWGHWLMQDKLDGFGLSILCVFAITIIVCFWMGFIRLDSQYDILSFGSVTKKIASYTILISFVVMLVFSIWEICGTADSHTESMRNGATSIPIETLSAIFVDFSKAVMLSFVAVAIYWYVRMCFILFSGRIRRLGIEVALNFMMLWYLAINGNDQLWIDMIVVVIAGTFLYDIWRLADFTETQFSMRQLESWVKEDDDNNK